MRSIPVNSLPGTTAQVGALVGARWHMLRKAWVKGAAIGLTVVTLGLIAAGAAIAPILADGLEVEVATLLGSLLLLFPALAFMAGMAAGGGTEAIPASQLVAFPISSRAVFLTSVLLAPLNVAWTLQAVAIIWMAAYVGVRGMGALLLVSLAALFLAAVTAAGLALSWLVTAVRSTWRGRRLTDAIVLVGSAALLLEVYRSGAESLVARLPLSEIAVRLVLTPAAEAVTWAIWLVALGGLAVLVGSAATTWALRRRDDDSSAHEGRPMRGRPWRPHPLRALLAVDWASARRSKPVRRGMVLFAVVPGLAGLLSAMPWQDMVILPGLVATGAALLFGVNSFALDGSGAAWLESTPRNLTLAFLSKTVVTAGVTTVIVAGALALGSLRAREAPNLLTATSLLLAAACAVLVSTAVAIRASVRHPHKADLRSARDTPAPPAAMTLHSLRLIAATTTVGVLFVIAVRLPSAWPVMILAGVVTVTSTVHLLWSMRIWLSPPRRSHVVTAVSYG